MWRQRNESTLPVDDTRISDDLAQAYDGYYVQVSPRVREMNAVCVPLPEPGAPNNTILIAVFPS